MDNLLSPEEVKSYLELEDAGLEALVEKGKLHAYKIGGAYLRFRKEEVLTCRQESLGHKRKVLSVPWLARVQDFWRFNNFYILSLLLIVALFLIVVRA